MPNSIPLPPSGLIAVAWFKVPIPSSDNPVYNTSVTMQCWKCQGPVLKKNLKSSSDLKHGKDNGYHGDQ